MLNPDIIPFSLNETKSWQQEIAKSFNNLNELFNYLNICDADQKHFINIKQFPLRVTRFYADLIHKNDLTDPLLLQIIPQTIENKINAEYQSDAVGDLKALKHPGLIHKYQGRVLLSLTQACGIHCRYCFRRDFPYADNIPDLSPEGRIMQYLGAHKEVHEIILSGGDPLMLSDKKLQALIQRINLISHIKTIRFHTRMPSILPSRITEGFLNILHSSKKRIVMVLHINHANEINPQVTEACQKLNNHGVLLLNQSVLLKNVNHSVKALSALSLKLFDSNVMPYYIHCLDKVSGTAHFDLPRKEARLLMNALKKQLPGYLVPRFVEEIQGEASKTDIF